MVLQDTWLFEGTIHDNIAYGNLKATEADIREAARATFVDRFVHSLPDGYDTRIDDEGARISRRGRSRLITIPHVLANPAILILDEATSSVDTRNRSAHPACDGGIALGSDEFCHRPSSVDDPRCRRDFGDRGRPDCGTRRSRRTLRWRPTVLTLASTMPNSLPQPLTWTSGQG